MAAQQQASTTNQSGPTTAAQNAVAQGTESLTFIFRLLLVYLNYDPVPFF